MAISVDVSGAITAGEGIIEGLVSSLATATSIAQITEIMQKMAVPQAMMRAAQDAADEAKQRILKAGGN